jgi:auxin efflux carrier family protein
LFAGVAIFSFTMSAVSSVIVASVQSVAKVFVIGGVGYASVKYPRSAPLLPQSAIASMARMCFHCLVLPLIFATIARSVTYDTLSSLWFVLVSAVAVVTLSHLTATLLGYAMNLHNELPVDFDALRVSAAFPNIVALPILIFPSLCEYAVVYKSFAAPQDETADSPELLYQQCVATSNTMIFVYFFAWSFLFWSLGHQQLLQAANQRLGQPPPVGTTLKLFWVALQQTLTSPGFIAMVLGFITACIPPLQHALFSPGGAIRFLGAALETLGGASSPISTMVVAASLVPPREKEPDEESSEPVRAVPSTDGESSSEPPIAEASMDPLEYSNESIPALTKQNDESSPTQQSQPAGPDESPIMSDPNFGTLRYRHSLVVQSLRRRSTLIVSKLRRSDPQMRKLHIWFTLSRLILAPALICALMMGLDCGGLLATVPPLAKLVVIVNAALPGALIVVVLLKSNPALSDTAAVVAKVYLPSYLLSIVTIAAWTAVGLWISIPHEDGSSFCSR